MSEVETLNDRVRSLLLMKTENEQAIIAALDGLVKDFGVDEVQRLCLPRSRHKNLLIHEFVRLGLLKTIEHAVNKLGFDINVQRESDGCTPLHLAHWYEKSNIAELLKHFQADMTLMNKHGESATDLERTRCSMTNIIWLNAELTSSDDPHILECAVIITDRNLSELERGRWIIHYEKAELEKLSDLHQKIFQSKTNGGNGLLDDSLASKTTKEEMESQLLELIKRHCPAKGCGLAGKSIHSFREVVRLQMPSVYNCLQCDIIDVASLTCLVQRWSTSEKRAEKERYIENIMQEKYPDGIEEHRAMYAVEFSIEILKLFKACVAAF